jgi:pseudouridine synthase
MPAGATHSGGMRLQRYLAQCGVASRRNAERLIADGRVSVNGATAQLGRNIDPETDTVALDGEPVGRDRKVYILLNKPQGVITSTRDTHDRRTVVDCLTGVDTRVYPVGRLDKDVEGALLLTNDGELAYRMTHPKYEVDKVYIAEVKGAMDDATARRLGTGIELDDGMTAPAKVKVLKRLGKDTLIRLVLHEGRKREVKRMCAAVGHPVMKLRRTAVGELSVRGMKPGHWRHLTDEELGTLRRLTRLG